MRIVCAWCQKQMGDKEPLSDTAVTHSICPECAKGLSKDMKKKPMEKNPKGYQGTLKLPIYIDTAISGVLHDGPGSLDGMWDRRMSAAAKKHFDDFLVSIHHPLGFEGMASKQRFKRFVMEYVFPYIEKNPKDFHNIEKSGFHRGEYVGYGGGTWRIRKYGKGERLWIATKQGGGGEFYGSSFADLSAKLDALVSKKNPGLRWHGLKELEADQQDRHAKKKEHKDFFHGKSVAHLESGLAARAMHMNPLAVFTVGNPKRRPLKYKALQAIKDVRERHLVKLSYDQLKSRRAFGGRGIPSPRMARKILKRHGFKEPDGNPPNRINAGIAGVVYSRCLEVRAEKTSLTAERAGFKRGLYKHPFARSSRVEILALDNGDLLLHSTVGVKLW